MKCFTHAALCILNGDASLRILSTDASGCFFINVTFTAEAEISIRWDFFSKAIINSVSLTCFSFIQFYSEMKKKMNLFVTYKDLTRTVFEIAWWTGARDQQKQRRSSKTPVYAGPKDQQLVLFFFCFVFKFTLPKYCSKHISKFKTV